MNLSKEKYESVIARIKRHSQNRCFKKAIELASHYKIKGVLITERTIREKYGLTKKQIENLQVIEIDNPYYKCAGNMRLFLLAQVEYVAMQKTPC